MNFLAPILQNYLDQHVPQEPVILQELTRETHLKTINPRMLSGPYQGRVLSFLSKLLRPACILEIGTFTGYSAICLGEGLRENGKLYTIEVDPEMADFAQRYFEKAGLQEKITSWTGDARKLISNVVEPIDLAFIDGEKREYLEYYELILARLRPGGLLLADNVLWNGQVVDKDFQDPQTQGIRQFNAFVHQDARVEAVLLPIRDGLFFIQKK